MKSKTSPSPQHKSRITVFRNAFYVFIGLCLAFSTSCSPTAPTPSPTPTPKTATRTPSRIPPSPTPPNTPTPQPSPKTEICSPLAVLTLEQIPPYITQPFIAPGPVHNAEHPEWTHKDDGHHGTDIGYYQINGKLFTGTPVRAALKGQIAAIIHNKPPYGDMIIIETTFENIPPALIASQKISSGSSLYTLYAHLQNLQDLKIGDPVACGQQIAETGLTGFTGGPHLHFETRWAPPGKTFNSMAYYRADATPEELTNYITWRMSAVFHLFDPMALLGLPLTEKSLAPPSDV